MCGDTCRLACEAAKEAVQYRPRESHTTRGNLQKNVLLLELVGPHLHVPTFTRISESQQQLACDAKAVVYRSGNLPRGPPWQMNCAFSHQRPLGSDKINVVPWTKIPIFIPRSYSAASWKDCSRWRGDTGPPGYGEATSQPRRTRRPRRHKVGGVARYHYAVTEVTILANDIQLSRLIWWCQRWKPRGLSEVEVEERMYLYST